MATDPTPAQSDETRLARLFHDTYERLAPQYGYETRTDTKSFDPNSPNGKLMIAVCNEVIEAERQRIFEAVEGALSDIYAEDASDMAEQLWAAIKRLREGQT